MADGRAAIARLFVAVDLPPRVKDEVARVASSMRANVPQARWVPRDNLHITLAFLGSTPLVDEVCEAVRTVAAALAPFDLHLEETGAFPSARRARVVWVGLGGDAEALAGAARATGEALAPLGFAPEERSFAAHLTIARLKTPASVQIGSPSLDPSPFRVDAITVFESRLGRPAPRYEPVATCPLSGA